MLKFILKFASFFRYSRLLPGYLLHFNLDINSVDNICHRYSPFTWENIVTSFKIFFFISFTLERESSHLYHDLLILPYLTNCSNLSSKQSPPICLNGSLNFVLYIHSLLIQSAEYFLIIFQINLPRVSATESLIEILNLKIFSFKLSKWSRKKDIFIEQKLELH